MSDDDLKRFRDALKERERKRRGVITPPPEKPVELTAAVVFIVLVTTFLALAVSDVYLGLDAGSVLAGTAFGYVSAWALYAVYARDRREVERWQAEYEMCSGADP